MSDDVITFPFPQLVRDSAATPPFETYDVRSERSSMASMGIVGRELSATLRTSSGDEDVSISFTFDRFEGGQVITTEAAVRFPVDDAQAFAELVATVVEQARRDGTLPAAEG